MLPSALCLKFCHRRFARLGRAAVGSDGWKLASQVRSFSVNFVYTFPPFEKRF
jgi:hypothetical protein